MNNPYNKTHPYHKFYELSIEEVEENLNLGRYNEKNKRFAEEWIRKRREEEAKANAEEGRKIARSNNKAMWWTVRISVLALIVSIISLVLHFVDKPGATP